MYRLLIVGKDHGAEENCRREFKAEGFEVECTSDPREAVAKVKNESTDLIILDLCMPGGKGVDCLESVRECDGRLPVVLHGTSPESWGDFRLWSANSLVEETDDLGQLKDTVRGLLPHTET